MRSGFYRLLAMDIKNTRVATIEPDEQGAVDPYAVRLLQAAATTGSRNPDTAASTQRPAAANAAPSTAFRSEEPTPPGSRAIGDRLSPLLALEIRVASENSIHLTRSDRRIRT